MAKETFYCESSRQLFGKKNEKGLYLEISDTMITGKGIIYLENRRNEYIGDINYEIKTITRFEQTVYDKADTFIIYIRSSSLYGVEKVQIRLPGLKDSDRAAKMLTELMEKNKDVVNSVTTSMVIPEPIQSTEFRPRPEVKEEETSKELNNTNTHVLTPEEYQKKLARLETIYQTGIMTEKEYRTSKAEYISAMRGINSFFSKVKVNLQYSEIGFLSETEFTEFKRSTVEECSNLHGVSGDVLKQNLSKLLILNICEILTDAEYEKICADIVRSVQYVTMDSEEAVIEKIEKWPILKECEIITETQYEQFIRIVADDTKIKLGDSIPVLEHKLRRLTTLSKTFIFTAEEFARKKQEFIADMTVLDFSSDVKLKGQLERIMALKRFDWLSDVEYESKKNEVLRTIEDKSDVVEQMKLYGLLADVSFISKEDYGSYKGKVIDGIFQHYSDISELQAKAQSLMSLKNAGVITEAEFTDFKKRLLNI